MMLLIDVRCKFQSTPLREGRHLMGTNYTKNKQISIHAPARGATLLNLSVTAASPFQSTPLREGRPLYSIITAFSSLFQSTPLREGRQLFLNNLLTITIFQSTPLREGRQLLQKT